MGGIVLFRVSPHCAMFSENGKGDSRGGGEESDQEGERKKSARHKKISSEYHDEIRTK